MSGRIQESLKIRLSEAPRATTPRLLIESVWVTFGSPLLLPIPDREPSKKELLSPTTEAQDELIDSSHQA